MFNDYQWIEYKTTNVICSKQDHSMFLMFHRKFFRSRFFNQFIETHRISICRSTLQLGFKGWFKNTKLNDLQIRYKMFND